MFFPRTKISKASFEGKLIDKYGSVLLFASPHIEEGKRLTLYYVKDATTYPDGTKGPKHIGTWMSGEGWIF